MECSVAVDRDTPGCVSVEQRSETTLVGPTQLGER